MPSDEEIRLRCLELAMKLGGEAQQTMEIAQFLFNYVKTGIVKFPKKEQPNPAQTPLPCPDDSMLRAG